MNDLLELKNKQIPIIALDPNQAAEALNICRSTLDRLTREGKLPCWRDGKTILYGVKALEDRINGTSLVTEGQDHGQHQHG